MRLVVDTNLLVSALFTNKSLPTCLLARWRTGYFDLLTSQEQIDEFSRVTRYPRIRPHIVTAMAGRLLNDLRRTAIMLERLPPVELSRDPFDDYLLAMAAAGAADFLVTGDKRDLLPINAHAGAKILTVREFLTLQDWLP